MDAAPAMVVSLVPWSTTVKSCVATSLYVNRLPPIPKQTEVLIVLRRREKAVTRIDQEREQRQARALTKHCDTTVRSGVPATAFYGHKSGGKM